ncbi:MAG: class I SAM-dependent methyltransferase [Firmicutes bacterium]|nr:class I SAM-dependent methyltransferase [Bacillota bacterium]
MESRAVIQNDIEDRVRHYWTLRSESFSEVRKEELENEIGDLWKAELLKQFPEPVPKDILDVGTGAGFFAILLSEVGHNVTGIDLTPDMIEEAKKNALLFGVSPCFKVMDAQELEFADETFDAVVTRNLTWTLPDPERAYKEWYRVLRRGGVLINYDANYAQAYTDESKKLKDNSLAHGHKGVTAEMAEENKEITLSMSIASCQRPGWDAWVLKEIGFSSCEVFDDAGNSTLQLYNGSSPIFCIRAVK